MKKKYTYRAKKTIFSTVKKCLCNGAVWKALLSRWVPKPWLNLSEWLPGRLLRALLKWCEIFIFISSKDDPCEIQRILWGWKIKNCILKTKWKTFLFTGVTFSEEKTLVQRSARIAVSQLAVECLKSAEFIFFVRIWKRTVQLQDEKNPVLGGVFKYFLFSPLFAEDFLFD